MKSLLDIQQDVRNLENILHDVQGKIKTIGNDIDGLRTENQNMNIDYSKIEILSKQLTIGKHPLGKLKDDKIKRTYIEMLLSIVRLDSDEEVTLNRLVFIQRIQADSGIGLSLEDLYKDSFKISLDSFYDMVEIIPVNQREWFVVDSLVVAYLGGAANAEISEYIVGIFTLFGINKERMKTLSLVARVALSQGKGKMKKAEMDEFLICAKSFKHYINPDVLQKIIISQRKIVVEFPVSEVIDFKWKVQQREKVKKGELIATYNVANHERGNGVVFITGYKVVEVVASDAGTIFQFMDNWTYYGVISHESDDKDSIKAWVRARRN